MERHKAGQPKRAAQKSRTESWRRSCLCVPSPRACWLCQSRPTAPQNRLCEARGYQNHRPGPKRNQANCQTHRPCDGENSKRAGQSCPAHGQDCGPGSPHYRENYPGHGKASYRAAQAAKASAKAAAAGVKAAAKATVSAVKAIIAATKALMTAILAGGWIAVAVIIIICLIGLIAGSCFGIFFSGEDSGAGQSMQTVVREINEDYEARLDAIQANISYDVLEMCPVPAPSGRRCWRFIPSRRPLIRTMRGKWPRWMIPRKPY